jgi:methylase of polypeptide subunit release factors
MRTNPEDCPLHFDGRNDFVRTRVVLENAQFSEKSVLELMGAREVTTIHSADRSDVLQRTSGGSALETLVRLFVVGASCDLELARRAVEPMGLEEWVEAGLLCVADDSVSAAVQLLPFRGMYVASDFAKKTAEGLKSNYVMGIAASSLTLAHVTVRRPSRSTLDLGTGCGILAFLAAPHSDRVLAVDRNPRAVNLAAFNAALSGLDHVECLAGDFFAPVRGRSFDLVISNPPFVISPSSRFIYRDSGMHGDDVTQQLVRQVPAFLNEGGFCQILCNWLHRRGEDWSERLGRWFDGTGCDALVLRSETTDAATYANTWIRHTEIGGAEQFDQQFAEWMAYYERERIEAMSSGFITMRRSTGRPNWFHSDDAPEKIVGPGGEAVLRRFELYDFLEAARGDDAMLDARLGISPDVRLEQTMQPVADGWRPEIARLHFVRGLTYSGNVDVQVVQLMAGCQAGRTLREVLGEMARSVEGADSSVVMRAGVEITRKLIERGFLVPVATS